MIIREDMTAEERTEQAQLLSEGWCKDLFNPDYDIWFDRYCAFMNRVQARILSEGKEC
jgi:hypothetical protein